MLSRSLLKSRALGAFPLSTRSHGRFFSASALRADDKLNKVSANITQPKAQGASQAMLYA
ncbi:hypothetical protein BFJ63_vAg19633, partial [Fusarium oxysporum f. sp. narcissi]